MRIKVAVGTVLALLALATSAAPAQASRALLDEELLQTSETKPIFPPPEGQIEGACGLAVSPAGSLYVSDYYHEAVHVYGTSGGYSGTPIKLPPLGGVCGLAFASTGALYANEWHERVVRLQPSVQEIEAGNATGVAVGPANRVYVNNRTHVSVYEPTGALLLEIGEGSLDDGYGLAVDGSGRVYAPDGGDDTVKVYDPAVKVDEPVLTIAGPPSKDFVSLVDTDIEIDPTNGHLLIVDNLKPGFEHPQAAVYEFDASGAFLGQLPGAPVFGEPPGLAVDPKDGKLFVTSGNDERSNVFLYAPHATSFAGSPPGGGEEGAETGLPATSTSPPGHPASGGGPTASISEVVQRRGIRVSFGGKLTPRSLPRRRAAPVGILVEAKIAAVGGETAPQLRRLAIEINRHGHFSPQGLPTCLLDEIQPSTTAGALEACRPSLVGEGHFSASVRLPQQSPFPSEGKVLTFSGRIGGRPAILAHIYGTQPVPTSYVLPFLIRDAKGAYGTVLEASLPQATGEWGYVTGLRMSLRRVFSHRGRTRSYLTASCPAPPGFPSAVFPLARTSFAFAGGTTLVSILNRSCKAAG